LPIWIGIVGWCLPIDRLRPKRIGRRIRGRIRGSNTRLDGQRDKGGGRRGFVTTAGPGTTTAGRRRSSIANGFVRTAGRTVGSKCGGDTDTTGTGTPLLV